MKIALGSDHRGVEALEALRAALAAAGHAIDVLGVCDPDGCDYPDIAFPIAVAVAAGEADYGVLVCGSGNGMAMAANKVAGVRAALGRDALAAAMSRRHNDANVLCLSSDAASPAELVAIVTAFLDAPFEGGRHARRVAKIAAIERGEDPRMILRAP
jgi:ribose 5-phosphate isomerase B